MSSGVHRKKADRKIVIIGTAAIGKTTLIHRYIEGSFEDQISTIGASFSLKQWGPYNIAIWDTAGEERYQGLSAFYCRGASAAILAYDVTDASSFLELRERFIPLLSAANEDCLCAVVGTKVDLLQTGLERAVESIEALQLAKETNPTLKLLPVFETSAKSGQQVNELFEHVFQAILPDSQNMTTDCAERASCKADVVDLERPANSRTRSGCC